MLCLFYLCALFTKVARVPHPLQDQQALKQQLNIGENLFSSSLNAISILDRLLLKISLSLGFHLLPFSSPCLYLKSIVQEHVVKCREIFVKKTKLQPKYPGGGEGALQYGTDRDAHQKFRI